MKVKCTSLLAASAAAAIASLAAAQSNCCTANGGLGCDDPTCQAAVCAADSFCCAVAWDSICADEAANQFCVELCAGGGGGCGTNDCCTASPDATPGCNDQACCDAVCGVDAFCCNTQWDSICAGEANDLCAICASGPSNCCTANGGLGCDDPKCQAIVCAADSFCCQVAWDSICAGEAASMCGDLCNGGGNPACPSDNDCCASSPTGTPGCNDSSCCNTVCNLDPFCCDTMWDGICASEAVANCGDLCAVACPPSDNDCCVASPTGTPGCADSACCSTVCAVDSFCCAVAWDSICASEAFSLCGCTVSCPISDHDCYTQGGPGCTDEACCSLVCGADSFCCQVAWDGICVSEAFSFCGIPECPFECTGTDEGEPCGSDTNGGCNTPPSGNSTCCFANGGVGCDDPACQDTVCLVDSFCCAVAWDGICAGEAIQLCGDLCSFVPAFGSIECGETICGTAWAAGGTRDTDWFVFNVSGVPGTLVTVSITNQIPMVIGVVNSTDCSTASFLNPFAVSGYCGTASFTFCFAPGTYWLFAAPNGFDGFPCESGVNNYALTVTCEGECTPLGCGSAGHDCYTAGGPFCDDVTCCETVCSVDSFCCQVSWDSICVNEAFQFCGVPKCPFTCDGEDEGEPCGEDNNGGCNVTAGGDSNCCVANGGVGCDDPTCQAAVCAADSFCCAVAWDGICAGEALTFCPDLCSAGVPEFGEISCNETICATAWASGGTRDTDWFILDLPSDTEVTVSAVTQLPLVIGIVNSVDCSTASFLDPFAVLDFCGKGSFVVTLPAGVHWVFAAPNSFDGFPCGSGANNYSLTVTCPIACIPGPDRNGDGCVNGADIAIILGHWDPDGSGGQGLGEGDANCDGVVNGADITVVLGFWQPICP